MNCVAFDSAVAPTGGARMRSLRRRAMLRVRAAAICIVAAAAIAGANSGALAGDLNDSYLRGSLSLQDSQGTQGNHGIKGYGRWNGFYFGADIGAGSMNADFGDGTGTLIAFILRNTVLENEAQVSKWTTLPQGSSSGRVWGVFVGYNYQFDRLVLGAEATYNRPVSNFLATSTDALNRSYLTSDNYFHNVNVSAQGTIQLNQYGTLRARAGYVAGQFLPYAAIGVAIASVNYSKSATVSDSAFDVTGALPNTSLGPTTMIEAKNNAVAYGGVLALGVDVTLLPNLFLRGEWEYIVFAPVSGIRANVNILRAGLGFKF